jgi:hypothetical protein
VATFPRGHWARSFNANAAMIKKLGREQTAPGKVTWIVDPADDRLLRGLPAVGNRLGGAIRGSRPGDGLR